MTIIASCGHEVQDIDKLVSVEYPDTYIDHDRQKIVDTTARAEFCPLCACRIEDIGGRVVKPGT